MLLDGEGSESDCGKRKPYICWVVAIACAANGWHQPLTIGSHHFQWLGNLPCLTLQPCLTAEQVEQHYGCL